MKQKHNFALMCKIESNLDDLSHVFLIYSHEEMEQKFQDRCRDFHRIILNFSDFT